MTISSIRSRIATAAAAIWARCPAVWPMALGVGLAAAGAFLVALCVTVPASAAVRQIAAAEAACQLAAEAYFKAASAKLVAPAPVVGYDGQAVAWAKARMDFSTKE